MHLGPSADPGRKVYTFVNTVTRKLTVELIDQPLFQELTIYILNFNISTMSIHVCDQSFLYEITTFIESH